MDGWKTLEPVKLHSSAASSGARFLSKAGSGRPKIINTNAIFHGKLPIDLYDLILIHVPVFDIPQFSRCSRTLARIVKDGNHWEYRWNSLGVNRNGIGPILDDLEQQVINSTSIKTVPSPGPATLEVESEDDFGEFSMVSLGDTTSGIFPTPSANGFATPTPTNAFTILAPNSVPLPTHATSNLANRPQFIRAFTLIKKYLLPSLDSPPHLILASLFPPPNPPSIDRQSRVLLLLLSFLSATVQPIRNWYTLRTTLKGAVDRFEANLLATFDFAYGKNDEVTMKDAAYSGWRVWRGSRSPREQERLRDWEIGRVWMEKLEVFYEGGQTDSLRNFSQSDALQFDAMDDYISKLIKVVHLSGSFAVRVFPADSHVLLLFAERLANDVVAEYIVPLLTKAREISNEVFLQATAAAFVQTWRLVDSLSDVARIDINSKGAVQPITKTRIEDVIFRMFEQNMDEYLDEEIELAKAAFESICKDWNKRSAAQHSNSSSARFLSSNNPAQMKRTVLASFANVLLMPVTIVPKTVGAVGFFVATSGTAAVQGIAMLNPQKWMTGGLSQTDRKKTSNGYSRGIENEEDVIGNVFTAGDEDDSPVLESSSGFPERPASVSSQSTATLEVPSTHGKSADERSLGQSTRNTSPNPSTFDHLDLLLSLDVALELIHADRDCLKRVETFQGYPGHYGHKVRETIEELFILMLQALGEKHITPGFAAATEQMRTYRPAEHEETTSVAPLMQFFELVHIGDMIQSMVQVFFDKEMAPHIDRTDFLNAVMREKKRFENALDESVAAGLNAGTEVLMNQVEHIIWTKTGAREYYPQEGAPMELGPTNACTEAIACLEMHCKLLKGSTSKEVLEVFYQEVGIRLHGILQKHIKRQIISLEGGFQVIADLNAYHSFISSLKVSNITSDFANLKMLGHVFIVSDAVDLAQIVRDVTRYGGAFRPEDIYEFIQRRSDWKKIEKTVDKTMYNLSFREDCVIC